MDAINQDVLKQLQEYAQMYFVAIIEANTVDGECVLKPGKYSAKEIAGMDCKLPVDAIYNETVEISAETFRCKFPYRRIFTILAEWEAMSRAGKLKAVFEIGEVEEKSAKILVDEKTALGAYATKGMKVQRVAGNWWMPRKLPKNGDVEMFYELNGVMFVPGLRFSDDRIKNDRKSVVERCAGIGDEEIKKMFLSFLAKNPEAKSFGYFAEVARLVNLDTQSEESAAIMEAAREEKRKREEENARREAEEAERRRIAKEEARKQAEEEERRAAESLAKAKENFVSGKMISRNDFERIAESIDYEINIRTIGTLRKRVEWIEVDSEGTPTVYGTKRRAGLDGTFEVIREVYEKLKETAVQATETPQISTEAAETVNVSARGQNAEKSAEMPQILNCEWQTKESFKKIPNIAKLAKAGIIINGVGWHTEYLDQSHNVLARVDNLSWDMELHAFPYQGSGVFGKTALFECWEEAVIATIDALTDYLHTEFIEPPQSPTTPTDNQTIHSQEKHAQTARKEPKRAIKVCLIVQRPAYHFRGLTKMVVPRLVRNVPRRCSTAVMPHGSPPIRGDCIRLSIIVRQLKTIIDNRI